MCTSSATFNRLIVACVTILSIFALISQFWENNDANAYVRLSEDRLNHSYGLYKDEKGNCKKAMCVQISAT